MTTFPAPAGGRVARVFLAAATMWALSAATGCDGARPDGSTNTNTTKPATESALRPFAGTYRLGDGFTGSSLTIGLDGNGAYSEFHDVGGEANCPATAEVTEGVLAVRISAMALGEDGAPRDVIRRYVPVRWGERLYLLHDDEGADFCAAIHRGWEPTKDQCGLFYLREGDWRKPAPGRPELPGRFQGFLLSSPLEAKIARILDNGAAVVDAGSEDGFRVGMFLIATKTAVKQRDQASPLPGLSPGPEPVKVVAVHPHEATIERCGDFRLRHFILGVRRDWDFVPGGLVVSRGMGSSRNGVRS